MLNNSLGLKISCTPRVFPPYGHGNIKKRRLHNFANLSLFMNNLSYLIYKESHLSRYSINDIKSLFIAERYTREALKFYGQNGDDILISNAIESIAQFSMIHGDTG